MSAQINYGFKTAMGEAGGIVDLAPYVINSFANEADTGKMKFGVGVVSGTSAGRVNLPGADATAAKFEGIVVNRRTTEYDMEGKIHIRKDSTLGVMRYGHIYGRVAAGVTPAHGEPVYMIKSGDEAGYFTNVADGNLAINARFIGAFDATVQIAAIELHAPVIATNAYKEEDNND